MADIDHFTGFEVPFHKRLLLAACRHSYQLRIRSRFAVSFSQGSRQLRVPLIRGLGWNHLRNSFDTWNPCDAQIHGVISKLYREGRRGCFVDIGANEGRVILHLRALDLDLSYLGFEPQVEGAYYIQELIRINKLKRYHVLAIALGSKSFMATMHRHHSADVTATYTFSGYSSQGYSETILVPVSTGDDQLAALDNEIFVIKLDTEGSEFEALQGMNRTLQKKRPPVCFEVMGYRNLLEGTYSREFNKGELSESERRRLIENRRANMATLEKFWREQGYTTHLCCDDGTLRQVESLDPGPQSDDNRREMNYLALPI